MAAISSSSGRMVTAGVAGAEGAAGVDVDASGAATTVSEVAVMGVSTSMAAAGAAESDMMGVEGEGAEGREPVELSKPLGLISRRPRLSLAAVRQMAHPKGRHTTMEDILDQGR